MLYAIDAINFELNGLDLKPNSAEVLETKYYKDVFVVKDSEDSDSDSEILFVQIMNFLAMDFYKKGCYVFP